MKFNLALFAFASMTTPVYGNLLENGSFEETAALCNAPDFVRLGANVALPPDYIPGWLVEGNDSVDWLCQNLVWEAADGVRNVDLSGGCLDAGRLTQSFSTDLCGSYTLRFSLAGNNYGGVPVKRALVEVGNLEEEFSFDVSGLPQFFFQSDWESIERQFIAEGTTTTLSFEELNRDGFGALIDDVSVEPCTGAECSGVCGRNNEKVLICHNGVTICIAKSGLAGHMKHDDTDYCGPCI